MNKICDRCHKEIPAEENYLTYLIQYSHYNKYDEHPISKTDQTKILCQNCIEKGYYLNSEVKFQKIKRNLLKKLINKKKNNF